jgi:hypothetical protein
MTIFDCSVEMPPTPAPQQYDSEWHELIFLTELSLKDVSDGLTSSDPDLLRLLPLLKN